MAHTILPDNTLHALQLCYQALEDKKALDLVMLDVSGCSSITDYFILASGNSDTHLKALRGTLESVLKEASIPVVGVDYEPQSGWVVVDGFDFMVHLFLPEVRELYHIEALWRDAKRMDLPSGDPKKG